MSDTMSRGDHSKKVIWLSCRVGNSGKVLTEKLQILPKNPGNMHGTEIQLEIARFLGATEVGNSSSSFFLILAHAMHLQITF